MSHADDPSGSASAVDVDSIVPTRAIQQAAADHDVAPDALRAALQCDLERNREMAAEIREQRPIVYEADDYLVALATDGVTTETPLAVLSVYRAMDGSDTDYAAGYPLVVPVSDDEIDYAGFENAANSAGDLQ